MPLSKQTQPTKHRKGKAWRRVRKVLDTNEKSPTYGKMVRIARRSKYLFTQLPPTLTPEWKAMLSRTGFDYEGYVQKHDPKAYQRILKDRAAEAERIAKAKLEAERVKKGGESYIERMAREAKERNEAERAANETK